MRVDICANLWNCYNHTRHITSERKKETVAAVSFFLYNREQIYVLSKNKRSGQVEEKKKEIRISVRNLVEFILRSGDLDNSSGGFGERDAMQAGTRVHQQIQKKRGVDYRAEVPLVHEKEYEHFTLRVEGRADGMYEDGTTTVIEEIKGTYRDLEAMEEPVPVHLAQAKCYACIYGLQNCKEEMGVLMTYTLLSSEEEGLLRSLTKEEVKPEHSNWRIRHFLQMYKLPELEQWFDELLDAWFIWAEFQYQWQKARDASMQHLEFPFPYRKGQRELVSTARFCGKKNFSSRRRPASEKQCPRSFRRSARSERAAVTASSI